MMLKYHRHVYATEVVDHILTTDHLLFMATFDESLVLTKFIFLSNAVYTG